MLNNVKIGPKLVGAFVFVAIIAAGIGITGLHFLSQVGATQDDMAEVRLPSAQALLTMNQCQTAILVGERGLSQRRMFADRTIRTSQFEYIDEAWKRAQASWDIYEPLPKTEDEARVWKEFVPAWETWKRAHGEVRRLAEDKARLVDSGVPLDDERLINNDALMFEQSLAARQDYLAAQGLLTRLVDSSTAEAKRRAEAGAAAPAENRAA